MYVKKSKTDIVKILSSGRHLKASMAIMATVKGKISFKQCGSQSSGP